MSASRVLGRQFQQPAAPTERRRSVSPDPKPGEYVDRRTRAEKFNEYVPRPR